MPYKTQPESVVSWDETDRHVSGDDSREEISCIKQRRYTNCCTTSHRCNEKTKTLLQSQWLYIVVMVKEVVAENKFFYYPFWKCAQLTRDETAKRPENARFPRQRENDQHGLWPAVVSVSIQPLLVYWTFKRQLLLPICELWVMHLSEVHFKFYTISSSIVIRDLFSLLFLFVRSSSSRNEVLLFIVGQLMHEIWKIIFYCNGIVCFIPTQREIASQRCVWRLKIIQIRTPELPATGCFEKCE